MQEYQRIWHTAGLRHVLSQAVNASDLNQGGLDSSHSQESFLATLPESLRFYWQRVRLPLKIVWTYWELDEDMRGKPDPDRLSLWRSIMLAKNWKEDQVCFWPIAISSGLDQSFVPQAGVLASLTKLFLPSHVFCFGRQSHLALKNFFKQTGDMFPSQCMILYLPGAQDMLPDNKDAKQQTWQQIKNLSL